MNRRERGDILERGRKRRAERQTNIHEVKGPASKQRLFDVQCVEYQK